MDTQPAHSGIAVPPLTELNAATLASGVFTPNDIKAEALKRNLFPGPLAVIFVRHGRSAGNERKKIARLGDEHQSLKERYSEFPDYDLPLVSLGRSQSRCAGRYLAYLCHRGLLPSIDRGVTSPFTRPKETMQGVIHGIRDYCSENKLSVDSIIAPRAPLEISPVVGERFWGDFNRMSKSEQDAGYDERESDPYFWTPGTYGERMEQVLQRARSFFQKLHRPSYAGKVILVASHGELINAAELALHELDPFGEQFKESFRIGIPNCGIYIFSTLPFAPAMNPLALSDVSGFKYYLKAVPYQLTGKDAQSFREWSAPPQWRTRSSSRHVLEELPESVTLTESSRSMAHELAAAGIGESGATPRV